MNGHEIVLRLTNVKPGPATHSSFINAVALLECMVFLRLTFIEDVYSLERTFRRRCSVVLKVDTSALGCASQSKSLLGRDRTP